MERCSWPSDSPLMIDYHDNEYGVYVSDNNVIFERLMLEIYQAGLTWRLVLEKREGFNKAFHEYNIEKVAKMTDEELEELREDPNIIRNRLKINTTRHNAQNALRLIEEYGSLEKYLKTLDFELSGDPKVVYKPLVKQMKKDGWKFIGPLILEEFFKSIGFNKVPHEKKCFLYE